jgi:subtilisin family serine protease
MGMLVVSCAAPAVDRPIAPTATPFTPPAVTQPAPSAIPSSVPTTTALPAPLTLPEVQIARYPQAVDYSSFFPKITSVPEYDPKSGEAFQVDLRSRDLTKIDLTASLTDLMYADFDSKTQWPAADKIPAEFDWQKIMEIGKDPGLGIRNLHVQGITGKGVGIAIIDQILLVHHVEYKDRVRIYEETDDLAGKMWEAQMHGPAVASIAVGQSVGVAPEADLY